MKKSIYLFRHGETDWNHSRRFQGQIDTTLNHQGIKQAESLVLPLKNLGIEMIFSSDLKRAYETASIIAQKIKCPILTDPRFREANIGEAQGLTQNEIIQKYGIEHLKNWRSDLTQHQNIRFPGGESGQEIFTRSYEALKHYLNICSHTSVGLATHGGVIRRLIQKIMPTPIKHIPIPNAGVYLIYYKISDQKFEFAQSIPYLTGKKSTLNRS